MKLFGVKTEFNKGSVKLSKSQIPLPIAIGIKSHISFDFSSCPDLAQTVAVTAAGLGVKATLSGLHSLRIKETDRIAALQNELKKFGTIVHETSPGTIEIIPSNSSNLTSPISTYDDHRMAMAFAPAAFITGSVLIENPSVVEKSYPDYWKDLSKVGFEINQI
jgi:3-phosphoshikimate 1-carboxyvinyltransferase